MRKPNVVFRNFTTNDLRPSLRIIKKTLSRFEYNRAKESLKYVLYPVQPYPYEKRKIRLKDVRYTLTKMRVGVVNSKVVALGGVYSLNTYKKGITGVDWFAVSPEYQGFGIGTKLMKWMIKEAKNQHSKILIVWAVKGAETFYQKFNFKRSDRVIRPRETSILLLKKL